MAKLKKGDLVTIAKPVTAKIRSVKLVGKSKSPIYSVVTYVDEGEIKRFK